MEKDLLTSLLKVQKELPVIKRDVEAFKYKYAPLEVIWDKVGKILSNNGFAVTNEVSAEGVTTTAHHDKGELRSFFAFSGVLKPQDRGSEITYGRRYNLTAIFNIQLESEDDDAQSANKASNPQACPNCGKQMVLSRAGKPYCKGKYDGTCSDYKPEYSEPEKRFINSLK